MGSNPIHSTKKNLKKVLDKPLKLWYNKNTKERVLKDTSSKVLFHGVFSSSSTSHSAKMQTSTARGVGKAEKIKLGFFQKST